MAEATTPKPGAAARQAASAVLTAFLAGIRQKFARLYIGQAWDVVISFILLSAFLLCQQIWQEGFFSLWQEI